MKIPATNPIAAAGISFSRESRFLFWTGWLALTLSVLGLLFGEFVLRTPDSLSSYFFEAFGFLLSWLVALYAADRAGIALYRRTWFQLKDGTVAPVALEQEVTGRIRSELRANPLLRWFSPPKSRDIAGQLMTAALWWQAYIVPEGAPLWRRYGEWMVDALFGFAPLVAAVVVLMGWPAWKGFGVAALLAGTGLGVLGYSSIRLAARRQAIIDYFETWRGAE